MAMIKACQITPYSRPLPPAIRGPRQVAQRFGWHVRIETETGVLGWGDIAPWTGFGEHLSDLSSTVGALSKSLPGMEIPDLDSVRTALQGLQLTGVLAHGVELALLDVISKQGGRNLAETLCSEPSLLIPIHSLVEGAADAMRAVNSGVTTLKVKVGAEVEDDLARVRDVRSVAPQARLRLDANGRWSRMEALGFAKGLAELGDTILEQPVEASDLAAFAWLRDRVDVRLAADESVLCSPDEVLGDPNVQELVLKPMFLGGLLPTLELAQRAVRLGKSVCVTHALESEVGRLGAQAVAAGLSSDGVHGVCLEGQLITDGAIGVSRVSGLGWVSS